MKSMYPDTKKREYKTILVDSWGKPTLNNQDNINSSTNHDIIKDESTVVLEKENFLKYLYEYVNSHFNSFGHHVIKGDKFENWWHRHDYGTSYQPIVQCCYIRKGKELGYKVREHHSQKRITELAKGVHGIEYNRQTKVKSYDNIDVCWAKDDISYDSNKLILALEYEDSGKLDELFQELYLKLIKINTEFTVLCTRLSYEPDAHLISIIEDRLKKDNVTKFLIFIFIAPDSIVTPKKICFSEFIYQDFKIKEVENNKYFINIMQVKTPEGTRIEKLK